MEETTITTTHDHVSQSSPVPDTIEYSSPSQSKPSTAKTLPRLPSIRTTRTKKSNGNGYAPPASDRESWWRGTIKVRQKSLSVLFSILSIEIKDTPNPGSYETHLNTFIKEIVARPMTYGFKSDGRRRDPQPLEPKGKDLLPGAYSVEDFVDRYALSLSLEKYTRPHSFQLLV